MCRGRPLSNARALTHYLGAASDCNVAGAVANLAGELPLTVKVDGLRRPSESRYDWAAGGRVLIISTVIPETGLAFELISTYLGHQDTDTLITHLTLRHGRRGEIEECRHSHEQLNLGGLARGCAYDHANRLIERLSEHAHEVTIELGEHTFRQLERVE